MSDSGSRSTAPDVGIITTGHDVADARLHKITAALQQRDVSVELWGLGDPAGGPAGATSTPARGATWSSGWPGPPCCRGGPTPRW